MSHRVDEDRSESISPEALQQLMAGYVLYDLSPEESATLQRLMAQDPTIAQSIEQMQTMLELAYAPSAVSPPAALRETILNAHRALAPTARESSPPPLLRSGVPLPPTRRQPRPRWNGWGAIAAVIIAGLGISNVVMWRSLQVARRPSESAESITVTLTPTAGSNGPTAASVTLQPETLQATLTIEDLPPLAEEAVYVLWTVLQPDAPFTTDDKSAILTEVLTADDLENTAVQISLPPVYRDREWITAIAITVEAADAPQRHESSPVLFTAL